MAKIDPVEVEVLRNRLISIVYEMGAVLRRTAYSPNIRGREDCSCILADVDGQIVAQAEHIPGHLGMLTVGIPYLLRFFPPAIRRLSSTIRSTGIASTPRSAASSTLTRSPIMISENTRASAERPSLSTWIASR